MTEQTNQEIKFGKIGKWLTAEKRLQSVNFYGTFFWNSRNNGKNHLKPKITINICGLGFFYLYINGKKVSSDLFVPVWTNYLERDFSTLLYPTKDILSNRIHFLEYDISSYLQNGENNICVVVGNGWFRQNMRNIEGENSYNEQLLLYYEIWENGDKCLGVSDETVVYEKNFIKTNNIYFGEEHDYINYRDDIWLHPTAFAISAIITKIPNAPFYKQFCPSDEVIRSVFCKLVKSDKRKVFDVGENITGRVVVKDVKGKVVIRHSETLNTNGELDFDSSGGDNQIQTVVIENLPDGTEGYAMFTWQAFRYFDVEGDCRVERVEVIHTHLEKCVSFSSDNEILNWLFDSYIRTQLNNMHCGVPSDCPHRERLGYTGDGQITCQSAMTFFDADLFYRKWIRDICDCQDVKSGHVQHTAPFYGGGGGPGGWGSAIILVPYYHYLRYMDISVLEETLPYMEKWINSMEEFTTNGLIVREYEKGWCLGEWCTPNREILLPEAFVNTYYYIKSLEYLAEILTFLGKDNSKYLSMIKTKKAIFNDTYFDKKTGRFLDSKQGADAFGLMLGLGDERTKRHLNEKYLTGKIDTGIFGTEIVGEALYQNGFYQALFNILTSKDKCSFYNMMVNGATTLWETWNGDGSLNHPMFGGITRFISIALAGISVEEKGIQIQPAIVKGLESLEYKENSDRGNFFISYKKHNDKIFFNLYSKDKATLIFNKQKFEFVGSFNENFDLNDINTD